MLNYPLVGPQRWSDLHGLPEMNRYLPGQHNISLPRYRVDLVAETLEAPRRFLTPSM